MCGKKKKQNFLKDQQLLRVFLGGGGGGGGGGRAQTCPAPSPPTTIQTSVNSRVFLTVSFNKKLKKPKKGLLGAL